MPIWARICANIQTLQCPFLTLWTEVSVPLEGQWTLLISGHFISFTYSITEAGRNLWRPPSATSPASSKDGTSRLLRALSSWDLSICKDGDTTKALGNLSRCSSTLTVKYFFLYLNEISCVSVWAHCPLPCHWAQGRRGWLRAHWAFSRLNNPSVGLFPCDRCSKQESAIAATFPNFHYVTDYLTSSDLTIQRDSQLSSTEGVCLSYCSSSASKVAIFNWETWKYY